MNYYLGNKNLNSVRLKNKDFEKVLNLDGEAEEYLDEHKLKEVRDAIEFLKFYDSI